MRTIAIIQARMTSTRLPGKVLREIVGLSMLARVVARTRMSRLVQQILVVSSTDPSDDPILAECSRVGVDVFRGNLHDVLDRYYQAAIHVRADTIVRITSDCPLLDPGVIDQTVAIFQAERPDYASNVLERRFPRGLDTEVFSLRALERAWGEASEPYQRAHVTPFFYHNPDKFRLASLRADENFSQHRWTVDTLADLEFVRAVYERLPRMEFTWHDILHVLQREPALVEINAHVEQKILEQG